jgi:HEPN domain
VSRERGRARIEELLAAGELERTAANEQHARRLLAEAAAHLEAVSRVLEVDPSGALQLAYDAARKAAVALLTAQGLRSTTKGGHIAVQDAVVAQFGGPEGMGAFARLGRMRRQRHAAEYPTESTPSVTRRDADEAEQDARALVDSAGSLLGSERLGTFD